jgi:ribosomal protein S13
MKVRHAWVPLTLTLVALPLAPSVHAQPLPGNSLTVVQVSDDHGVLSITVRNTSDQAITAWAIRGRVDYEDGKTERVGLSTDGFLFGFRTGVPPYEPRVFAPGSEMTSRLSAGRVGATIVRALSFVPTAIVFDNAQAVGDGQLIERIFANRQMEWRALEELDRVLNAESLRSFDPRSIVYTLEGQLEEITAADIRATLSYKQVRHNLSLTHDGDRTNEVAVRARLESIRATTRRNLGAARTHRERR